MRKFKVVTCRPACCSVTNPNSDCCLCSRDTDEDSFRVESACYRLSCIMKQLVSIHFTILSHAPVKVSTAATTTRCFPCLSYNNNTVLLLSCCGAAISMTFYFYIRLISANFSYITLVIAYVPIYLKGCSCKSWSSPHFPQRRKPLVFFSPFRKSLECLLLSKVNLPGTTLL